jgi:hypothetical protein
MGREVRRKLGQQGNMEVRVEETSHDIWWEYGRYPPGITEKGDIRHFGKQNRYLPTCLELNWPSHKNL